MSDVVVALPETGSAIRKFADSGIQGAIDKALAGLPDGHTGAVVAYANTKGASLAVVAKLGEHWSVVGVLDKPVNGQLSAEAAVRFAW